MMIPCSDHYLTIEPQRVSHELHEDLWCIIEHHLPEFRRIVSPRNTNRTATFNELQDCICLLLHHAAQKAQHLHYVKGVQAINSCFKYFLYLCSNVSNLTPLSTLRIVDGIDHCLTNVLRLFKDGQTDLSKIHSPTLEHASNNLDLILIEIINKSQQQR